MDGLKIQDGDIGVSTSIEQNGLLLEDYPKIKNLATLHPPAQLLPRFQEVFLDRVDPLMKIIHFPTFWASLIGMIENPKQVSGPVEALVFSFYLATVTTLKDDECQSMLGSKKSMLYERYRLATRQALVNAEFQTTSNFTTLQAFAMFMVCTSVRNQFWVHH